MATFKVIINEGLIAAGKSDSSEELSGCLTEVSGSPCLCLLEPATKDDPGGVNPYLADYYKDPERWAMEMQVYLLQRRFRTHLQAQYYVMAGSGHAVIDRSFYGDVAFLEVQRRLGFVDDRQYAAYNDIYEVMTAFVRLPTVCLQMLVSPKVAQERIRRRAEAKPDRKCEGEVSLEYLSMLDEEIRHAVDDLRASGVEVITEHWDWDRPTSKTRRDAIYSLATHIHALPGGSRPRQLHRRRIV